MVQQLPGNVDEEATTERDAYRAPLILKDARRRHGLERSRINPGQDCQNLHQPRTKKGGAGTAPAPHPAQGYRTPNCVIQ